MNVVVGLLLLLNAVFNALTWPTFYRRVAKDPRARDAAGRPTRFLTVHLVLVVAALVIALASAVAGVASLIVVW
ncbi:MAG TPA: hypothetical protein VGC18_12225 [Lacisediminihabitans sp.]|uniref:SCO4848 family membrane protein n=1 Tax=Lacisediminihabitans sp. TaxID=2787631 RepID=UPI002ED7D132